MASNLNIFIFTRDLRLYDNTTLMHAMTYGKIVPVFIFTPEQIKHNKYRSERAIQFMLECLDDLEKQIRKRGGKLYYFYGKPHHVIKQVISDNASTVESNVRIFMNKDYTPYARERVRKLSEICKVIELDDYKLSDPATYERDVYKVFSPFYKVVSKKRVRRPVAHASIKFTKLKIYKHYKVDKEIFRKPVNKLLTGGRTEGLRRLAHLNHLTTSSLASPLEQSSMLSPYLKFNVLSVREVYYAMKKLSSSTRHTLIRSLYWRDFYMQLGLPSYRYKIKSGARAKRVFTQWKQGRTGVPIIDRLMIELRETGYLHNRSRMIVANYLARRCDWKLGERYFAQQLTDYDPCSNNGGWRYVASVGPDSMPPYRSFNPERQEKKYYKQ